MRIGTLRRIAVLASLALMTSSQLCMLTTCVPRLTQLHAAVHACCRATPAPAAKGSPPSVPGTMPCDIALNLAVAPTLEGPSVATLPAAALVPAAVLPAPIIAVTVPATHDDTGPPLARTSPASAGLRAPPLA